MQTENTSLRTDLVKAIAALSFIGIVDAAYLAYSRFTHTALSCNIFEGCDLVASSTHSLLFGIPLSYLGLLFYIGMFAVSIAVLCYNTQILRKLLCVGAVAGFALSLYFIYVQAVLIQAFCLYCLISAGVATCIFIASLFLKRT